MLQLGGEILAEKAKKKVGTRIVNLSDIYQAVKSDNVSPRRQKTCFEKNKLVEICHRFTGLEYLYTNADQLLNKTGDLKMFIAKSPYESNIRTLSIE